MSNSRDDYYDVQFTTRQLAILLGLLILIVGGVFVGGILVGRSLDSPLPAAVEASSEPSTEEPPAESPATPLIEAGTSSAPAEPPDPVPPLPSDPAPAAVPSPPPATTAPPPPPLSATQGDFTIQVAAVRDQQAAEALQQELTALGLQVYLEAAPRGLIRVRVGRFVSREAARDTVALLQANQHQAIIVLR